MISNRFTKHVQAVMALDAEHQYGEALRRNNEITRAEGFFKSSHEKAAKMRNESAQHKSAVHLGIAKGSKHFNFALQGKLPSIDEESNKFMAAGQDLAVKIDLKNLGIVEA